MRDLIAMLDDLKHRGVKFRSLTEAIDTETATGRAMWQMIGVLAELERSLISERTSAGVKAAKRRGVKFGRKRKLTFKEALATGVVVRIRGPAHARDQTVFAQQAYEGSGSVLHPAIRMMHQARRRLPFRDGSF